eukprot:m.832252 g.832252  ORF g.832252 m.832252 type:complete len:122 (+) comp59460_c0_seq3:685-1050(+)
MVLLKSVSVALNSSVTYRSSIAGGKEGKRSRKSRRSSALSIDPDWSWGDQNGAQRKAEREYEAAAVCALALIGGADYAGLAKPCHTQQTAGAPAAPAPPSGGGLEHPQRPGYPQPVPCTCR